jgi:hypothetical protein
LQEKILEESSRLGEKNIDSNKQMAYWSVGGPLALMGLSMYLSKQQSDAESKALRDQQAQQQKAYNDYQASQSSYAEQYFASMEETANSGYSGPSGSTIW